MSMLKPAVALMQKDLRSFLRDRAALTLSLLVPVMLVTVFGWIMAYAFGGSGGMPKVSLSVYDADDTQRSQDFMSKLAQAEMLRVNPLELAPGFAQASTPERLQQLIRNGDAHHVLLIPPGFADSLASGQTPKLQMLRDPGRGMEDRVIQISLMQAIMTETGGQVWLDGMDRMLSKSGMQTSQRESIQNWMQNIGNTISTFAASESIETGSDAREAGDEEETPQQTESQGTNSQESLSMDGILGVMNEMVPLEVTDVAPPDRGKQVTYQQAQSVCGMTVMMLLFALTSCGSVLLTERENGTLRRLFAQPISKSSILLGKFLFVFVVGASQMAILFCYGEWIFRVGLFRDPISLGILSAVWVATAGAFGMFLATASKSSKQAEGLASLLILSMAALGGCWFPLQLMDLPPLLEALCKSTMTYWAMAGFQGMLWNQLPWYSSKLLTAIGIQVLWILALTTLSIVFYRRNYCRG